MPDSQLAPLTMTFEAMSLALVNYHQLLKTSTLPLWLPLSELEHQSALSMQDKACALTTDIWHSGDGDGRMTQNCHGLIGANVELIAAATKLNFCKDAFRQALADLKDKDPKNINLSLRARSQKLAHILRREGLSRLHLKQCYRHIPILAQGCLKVQFSWYSSGRSIKKISIEESFQKLLKLSQSSNHVQIQMNKLSNLRPGTALAQVQTQVPIMRVNAIWASEENSTGDSQWLRKARNAPLPLLVPLQEGEPLPSFNQPPLQPPKSRLRALRSDSLIEPTPLLPSLRVHCYRQ